MLIAEVARKTDRFHLAFLQFLSAREADFALSPYFGGPGRFDRIIEIDEQTGLS